MMTYSDFALRISKIAADQWDFFGDQTYDEVGHATHIGHKEGEDGWYQRVGQYWLEGVGIDGVDGRDHDVLWSAAFISWIMKSGGAGNGFRYSSQHSVYISQAIRDRLRGRVEAGYWGWRLNELKPTVGDLVCWSRQTGIDYDHQNGGDYAGHSDLIVDVQADKVFVIGGNVGNSVTKRPLPLDAGRFLPSITRGSEYVFAIMQNRIDPSGLEDTRKNAQYCEGAAVPR
jgi:hypothetical protein